MDIVARHFDRKNKQKKGKRIRRRKVKGKDGKDYSVEYELGSEEDSEICEEPDCEEPPCESDSFERSGEESKPAKVIYAIEDRKERFKYRQNQGDNHHHHN
jgi:hypothetical protein